ncbi:hypothetical protein PUR71_26610 [Streptomyces sp. SP17BM10]|uniref:hypothetical protein n=1 Tax=Streptomyces sp. SP17BM10 TaxID=3002530 RepID=UPI002E78A65A|nr:hypothetical protein [Streptomyces sp. SP17BM10]MEE1786449.1 hypothetical protein [Streptomyces sp. SP17BM10]
MTTATALIDVDDEPLERTIRLVAAPERPAPAPAPAATEADEARMRAAHCRFAMHYED